MTDALRNIQSELNAPKNLYNSFGKYSYRSCESILEAVKPLLKKYGAEVVITDKIEHIGDRFYVKAEAIFTCGDDTVIATAYAREPETKKGQDESQITGTASSYARKYALNGLFLIDDSKDADTDENHIEREARSNQRNVQDDPKVTSKEIEAMTDFAKEVDVSIESICERYGVNTLQDMTMSQYASTIRSLNATANKNKGGVA